MRRLYGSGPRVSGRLEARVQIALPWVPAPERGPYAASSGYRIAHGLARATFPARISTMSTTDPESLRETF